jgi:arylformamidase
VTRKPETVGGSNEALYNNRAAVPDHPVVMARWKASAEAVRAVSPPARLAYGPGARETIDLFEAGPDAPVVVFLHGGYWQALDPSWFSGIFPAFRAHGVSVAIPAYDLCPDVSLATIVDQARAAMDMLTARTGRRPVVLGHSAGGHLAACLLSGRRRRWRSQACSIWSR